MKEYGQDLLKKYENAKKALANSESKINKRFELVVNHYSKYMTNEDNKYLIETTNIYSLPIEVKSGIIMRTEAEYIKVNSNQGELFDK